MMKLRFRIFNKELFSAQVSTAKAHLLILRNLLQKLGYICCWAAHLSHLYSHWISQVLLINHKVKGRMNVKKAPHHNIITQYNQNII